jgi:hypothetical protein
MKFVQSEWDRFCSSIDSTKCVTISELPDLSRSQSWLAIKHDVETNVKRAYDIACIEARHGIRSTFFVQAELLEGNLQHLLAIAELGHEVTYHYDVLDSNNGDIKKATNEFSETVIKFEEAGFAITSVCPHGNPMMNRDGWSSNKDFFRDAVVSKRFSKVFDLVVQGKEKIGRDYSYVSDAGYGFKIISDIEDNDKGPSEDVPLGSIDEVLKLICQHDAVVISTHPHRWSSNAFLAVFVKARFILIRKVAIFASKSTLFKRLISKFYFMAKKF